MAASNPPRIECAERRREPPLPLAPSPDPLSPPLSLCRTRPSLSPLTPPLRGAPRSRRAHHSVQCGSRSPGPGVHLVAPDRTAESEEAAPRPGVALLGSSA